MLGQPLVSTGQLDAANEHFEKSIALYDPEQDGTSWHAYGQNPAMAALIWQSWVLWLKGFPELALDAVKWLALDEDDLKRVAELLDVSIQTVRREISRGRLGFIKVGGRRKVLDEQLAAYIQRQRNDPCQCNESGGRSRSTGSHETPKATTSTGRGMTGELDKLAGRRLVLAMKTKSADSPCRICRPPRQAK